MDGASPRVANEDRLRGGEQLTLLDYLHATILETSADHLAILGSAKFRWNVKGVEMGAMDTVRGVWHGTGSRGARFDASASPNATLPQAMRAEDTARRFQTIKA